MATTMFNGSGRYEKRFQQVNKNTSTGAYTARTLGMKPDLTSLTATAVTTATTKTYTANVISISDWVASAVQVTTLPAATVGYIVIHLQSKDPAHGTGSALSFECAGSDVFRTGSKVETTSGSVVTIDTSAADEATLTYTPVNASTGILTTGCYVYFTCFEKGIWNVATDLAKDPLSVTGTFLFSA